MPEKPEGAARPTGGVRAARTTTDSEANVERLARSMGGARVWVTARYEDGELHATVHAEAPYAGRSAVATYDVPADKAKALAKALADLAEDHGERAMGRAGVAAARSLVAAADAGEDL